MKKIAEAAKGLRERKKFQTRDAIIEAALTLFESQGYEETTVEEIADKADVSPRTLFRYFDSKADLILPLEDDEKSFGERLAERPESEHLIEAVRNVLREELTAHLEESPQNPRRARLMMNTPSLRARAFEHFNENQAELVPAFADRLGLPEDDLVPHLFAAAIGMSMWTAVDRWAAQGGDADELLPMLDTAFALLAAGLDRESGRLRPKKSPRKD